MAEKSEFVDLPGSDYPFSIEYIAEDNGESLSVLTIEGPGVLEVPSFAPRKVTVVTRFPGMTYRTNSHGHTTEEPT